MDTSGSQETTSAAATNHTLEVPYAFGKLSIYEVLDPKTNLPTGVFNITDQQRGFSFGVLKIGGEQNFQVSLDNLNNILESGVKQNTAESESDLNMDTSASTSSGVGEKESVESTSVVNLYTCPGYSEKSSQLRTKKSNMMKQKQENAYLITHPPLSNQKEARKLDETSSGSVGSNPGNSHKRQRVDIQAFKQRIENLNLPYSDMQWGTLLFYIGKDLVYTHHLWGDEPVPINRDTLLNVKVPTKFSSGGQYSVESLVDDFRHALADGFVLTRNSNNKIVMFQRIDAKTTENNSQRVRSNNYKLFLSKNDQIEVTSAGLECIYDDKLIQSQLISEVNSMKSAYSFTDNLPIALVLQNSFMNAMGVKLNRITRENVTDMPYHMVLKVHSGFDNLHSHMTKMINKYLTRKNSFFGQVYNIDPDVNLKTAN